MRQQTQSCRCVCALNKDRSWWVTVWHSLLEFLDEMVESGKHSVDDFMEAYTVADCCPDAHGQLPNDRDVR